MTDEDAQERRVDVGAAKSVLSATQAKAFLEKMAGIKQLSQVNGHISSLGYDRLVHVLIVLKMDPRGQRDVLVKRLKNHFRELNKCGDSPTHGLSSATSNRCSFDYLCVVDFEATCDDQPTPGDFQPEIIEFPAVLIDTRTRQKRFEFHGFCRPKLNPKLTDFCTELTGITQDRVDCANNFDRVLEDFVSFLTRHGLGIEHSWVVVTDSHYDMSRFMAQQCVISGIPFPKFAKQWINIRKTFSNFYRCQRLKLTDMLDRLGMEFEGRQHSGLDDARNILRVALSLMADGAELRLNESVDCAGRLGGVNIGNRGNSGKRGCRSSRTLHRRRK